MSLIVATIGRADELMRLIRSIEFQGVPEIELIVVDQNGDDRVKVLVEQTCLSMQVVYIRSARGLSLARNAGLAVATGSIVAFPDDDCWYPAGLLLEIYRWFRSHPATDLLCCAMRDEQLGEVACRWPSRSQRLDDRSVLRSAASASMFLRREALGRVGGFDEQLGLGAGTPYASGEDTDLGIRCLRNGFVGWFEKSLYVHHPSRDPSKVPGERALAYGIGFGYILRKHRYGKWMLLYHVARALGGALRALCLCKMAETTFYLRSARGRWLGYCGWKSAEQKNAAGIEAASGDV